MENSGNKAAGNNLKSSEKPYAYRKNYNDLSRRQQLRRLENQRQQDVKLLLSSFREQEEPKDSKNETHNINENPYIDEVQPAFKESGMDVASADTEDLSNPDIVKMKCEEQDEIEFWEKFDYYLSDEEEKREIQPLTLWEKVATWALRNYTNRKSINEILVIFQSEGHNDLPKDARTLLGVPRKSSNIVPCGSGSYLHYGLERAVTDVLQKMPDEKMGDQIFVDINIDGLPLCKSSRSQLWPILGKISGRSYPEVFLIGAYHGYEKPNSIEDFLSQFIEEYKTLKEEGFVYNGKRIKICIHLVICDSPARSMITGTKSHN